MATANSKDQKLARLSSDETVVPPLPDWPALPKFLKERFPAEAEAIDQYQKECVEFFKKANVIANS